MNARIDALHAPTPPALREVTLEDKYTATTGEIYLSGIQALVRLPLMQRLRDQAAGLHTGGFVSGYRGSPLGGLDEALWHAKPHLDAHHVRFVPGVNEELAATAVWGSQQVHLLGKSDYDGVFGLWYGKGPGVDRSIDVFKHMNHAGTSRHGGVLLVAGDDHNAYSSTLPHQSDHVFAASMIPMLYPCNVQEYIELGLHGWAMSRFSGCAVGFKALGRHGGVQRLHQRRSVRGADAPARRVRAARGRPEQPALHRHAGRAGAQAGSAHAGPQDLRRHGVCAREPAQPSDHRRAAARGWASWPRARATSTCSKRWKNSASTKRWPPRIGIRLFKVSMPWPLEPEGIREFARGLEEILVVEEKRQVVEYQLKEQLYNWREDVRPRVIGKFDERGEWDVHNPRGRGDWLLSAKGDFSVAQVARVVAARIRRLGLETHTEDLIQSRLDFLEAKDRLAATCTVATPARARPGTARAAPTTPARACPKAVSRWPASAAT